MKFSSYLVPFSLGIGCIFFMVLLIGGFGLNQGLCGDISTSEPVPVQSAEPVHTAETELNIGTWFSASVWPHISEVDGQRCPSEPTCSSYSAQAFRKHGFFIGWMMTVDRLIHEADEGRHSPIVKQNGAFKIFDPVANNDFWWYGKNDISRD